jgi:2-hydroxychromene-2-carboxylate isomerase
MTTFSVSYDYRCPFARIGHLHVMAGLEAGADWEVGFVPFSLKQMHVDEGAPSVWDEPEQDTGLLALMVSVVARDRFPDQFLAVHQALFDLRHVHSGDLRDVEALTGVLEAAGVDADAVFAEIDDGWPLETVRKEHEAASTDLKVWGVPTFMTDDDAVFVRLMEAPGDDPTSSVRTVERIIDMIVGWPQLNEFKHTAVRR